MSSHMKMLRNKEFWLSFFVLGLLDIFVNGNNIGDKALKRTLIKTILGDASPQPSTMEYDNPHHDAKLRGVCVPLPSSHCKGTDGGCYLVNGNNIGDKALKTTLIKTILGDASPQPSTMEYDNPHHDAKLRGVCVPLPSSHCKGTDGACYCCIGPNMNICIRGLSLCNTICS
ncbi:hypothetical protein Lser_V15G22144 [Lactuca serriola]